MALLEVLTFPNPILRKVAEEVPEVTPELAQFAKDMLETMYDSQGIGLAAPQVGKSIRLLVMDTRPRAGDEENEDRYDLTDMTELEKAAGGPIIIFNPKILSADGKKKYQEGCLSVPSYFEDVERADVIEVEGLNEKGEKIVLKLDGLMSVCMQHEIDHLDGKLFIDRLSPLKGNRIKSKIKKFGYPKDDENEEPQKEKEDLLV